MQVTDEIRWFFPGAIPAGVLGWFRDGAPIAPAPKRTDIYLPLPERLALSVKLREGRLEIKTQAGTAPSPTPTKSPAKPLRGKRKAIARNSWAISSAGLPILPLCM